jgi:hypothetical protein
MSELTIQQGGKMKSRYRPKQVELPDKGPHTGVIAAVDYRTDVSTSFGTQNQVRLRIDIDQDGGDGYPLPVFLRLHDSLHPNARLYQVLTLLGFPDPQPGFDFNTLLGLPVEFEVEHNIANDGRVWPNIKDRELYRQRTAEQKAADERSEERVGKAIRSVSRQQPAVKPDEDALF